SMSQSRGHSHYQPGYMMGTSQSNNSPTGGGQRVDEPPVVQTKAKMNHAFGGPGSELGGMESMFQSSRQRQTLADEDAPPMSSVNDIPTDIYADSSFQPRSSTFTTSAFGRARPKAPPVSSASANTSTTPTLYIIVFGNPADKYSLTVEYFKSLGDTGTSEVDPHSEIVNCFKIGYRDPADAMRAVHKNGEALGGIWMVGAKWADPAAAEALLNQPAVRYTSPDPIPMSPQYLLPTPTPAYTHSPQWSGTPIKLAPSSSAFRRGPPGASK
ncbi:hypothetical protein C8F01DRAFT_1326066, partial [Mycena amicta]